MEDYKSQIVDIHSKLDKIFELLGIEHPDPIVVPLAQVIYNPVDDLLENYKALYLDESGEKVAAPQQSWIDSEVHRTDNRHSVGEESVGNIVEPYAHKMFDEMTDSIREALLEKQLHTELHMLVDDTFGDVQPIEDQEAQDNDSSIFDEIYQERKVCMVFPEMSMSCDEISHIEVQVAGTLVYVTSIAENQKGKVAGSYAYQIFDEMPKLTLLDPNA